jgi:hypothetical protein
MIGRLVYAFLLTASVALLASDDSAKKDLTITLERTTCFGTCPAYKITVTGDGSVEYQGKDFVRVKGTVHSSVDASEIDQLIQAFLDAKYFELRDTYRSFKSPDGVEHTEPGDLPTTYTSIKLNGRYKRIENHIGAPQVLSGLEDQIDEVVRSKRWIYIDGPTLHERIQHGWNVNGPEARQLFLEAALRGDDQVARAFADERPDFNSWPRSPFSGARSSEIVRLLISAGADVNSMSNDTFGSPLAFAANLGDFESVKALLEAGANANAAAQDGRATPLMWAAARGNPDVVKALLSAGANATAKDTSGSNAISFAENGLRGARTIAKIGDPSLKATPDYEARYKEIEDLLVAAGATRESDSTK